MEISSPKGTFWEEKISNSQNQDAMSVDRKIVIPELPQVVPRQPYGLIQPPFKGQKKFFETELAHGPKFYNVLTQPTSPFLLAIYGQNLSSLGLP